MSTPAPGSLEGRLLAVEKKLEDLPEIRHLADRLQELYAENPEARTPASGEDADRLRERLIMEYGRDHRDGCREVEEAAHGEGRWVHAIGWTLDRLRSRIETHYRLLREQNEELIEENQRLRSRLQPTRPASSSRRKTDVEVRRPGHDEKLPTRPEGESEDAPNATRACLHCGAPEGSTGLCPGQSGTAAEHRFGGLKSTEPAPQDSPGPEQVHRECGCVTCICEDEKQCHGCGGKNCGRYPHCRTASPGPELPEAVVTEEAFRKVAAESWRRGDEIERLTEIIRGLEAKLTNHPTITPEEIRAVRASAHTVFEADAEDLLRTLADKLENARKEDDDA